MELEDQKLILNKELTDLDQEVLDFCDSLESLDIEYAIVSGYVAILTGRSRGTEDVDFLINPDTITEEKFSKLLGQGYWTVDDTEEGGVEERLSDSLSTRLAEEGKVIPNFELFYPSNKWDESALKNKLIVELKDSRKIFISPIGLQIAYKLYLGSDKDFEDALHLFTVFENSLDHQKLEKYSEQMNVYDELKRIRKA